MAGHWSSQQHQAEYRDLQASAMAVDCLGELAVLAGRRYVAIVKLSHPNENCKRIQRQSKYEIGAVQWNPHKSHSHIYAVACNQKVDLLTYTSSSGGSQHGTLRAHTRVISDLDWSPMDANRLATCSADTFTYLWDLRDTRRPKQHFQAVAGAYQVKWNKLNEHMLATTHDGDIRIWDIRKGNSPVQYIAAHLSKIHGLDWHPTKSRHLATSSQDCTVKFWDVDHPKQEVTRLPSSGSPVWRARFTPFGSGLMTVVVPQLRRGENSLFLWYLNDLTQPVHTFVGHTDVVLEFQWRKPKEETLDYQLVTWSKDQSLRQWRVEPHLQKLCGHNIEDGEDDNSPPIIKQSTPPLNTDTYKQPPQPPPSEQTTNPINIPNSTNNNHPDKEVDKEDVVCTPPSHSIDRRGDVRSPQQPKTLQQEINLVNFLIGNIIVEKINPKERTLQVSAKYQDKHLVKLTMVFPEMYPQNISPDFHFEPDTTISNEVQTKLNKVLIETASSYVSKNRSCIEPCLRQLVTSLEQIMRNDKSVTINSTTTPDSDNPSMFTMSQGPVIQPPSMLPIFNYGAMQDASVPFPRTSGARFCGGGYLICFTRKSEATRRISSNNDLTPRALSELLTYNQGSRTPQNRLNYNILNLARSPPNDPNASLYKFYTIKESHKKSRPRSKSRVKEYETRKSQTKVGPVIIYDTTCLLPINKQLAENYVLDTHDIPAMCQHNANAAAAVGRKDLVQLWSLASLASHPMLAPDDDPDDGLPWAQHPFGRKMIKSLIDHYSNIKDVQTLAMLSCTFGSPCSPHVTPPLPAMTVTASESTLRSPHWTDDMSASNVLPWRSDPITTTVRKVRSFSDLTDLTEDHVIPIPADKHDTERGAHQQNVRMLCARGRSQYDQYKYVYAALLYRWGLMNKRAEVLNFMSVPEEPHTGIEFSAYCQHCKRETRGVQCYHCKQQALQCSICHISVRGASSFCLSCGHGGHALHIKEWFKTHNQCPIGCGCLCAQSANNPMNTNPGVA